MLFYTTERCASGTPPTASGPMAFVRERDAASDPPSGRTLRSCDRRRCSLWTSVTGACRRGRATIEINIALNITINIAINIAEGSDIAI